MDHAAGNIIFFIQNFWYNPTGSLSSEGKIDKEKLTRHSETMDTYDEQQGK